MCIPVLIQKRDNIIYSQQIVFRLLLGMQRHLIYLNILRRFSLYVHKGGLKPHSFHFSLQKQPVCYLQYTMNGVVRLS